MKIEVDGSIENKIKNILDFPDKLRIKYGIIPKSVITLQEWEAYRVGKLAKADNKEKTRLNLNELENKIRQNDCFMEIVFIKGKFKEEKND